MAFVIDSLSRAGTESQLLALIANLDRARVAPSLVLLDGTSADSRELEPADCAVLRLGVTRLLGLAGARAALRLARHWRRRPPDVVQAYFMDSAYLSLPVARLLGARATVRVRNNLGYWLTRKHRVMNRLVRPLVSRTVTNSDAGRAALIEADGLDPARVIVLENGVDCGRFAGPPPPLSRDGLTVGCVANLRPVKNVDGFVRLAAALRGEHPHARFVVAGDGPERANLERLRDSLGLADALTFAGSVADVPALLGSLDVVVSPSHSEGMSNALLEALAAGRAVIATDVGASTKLVGSDGWLAANSSDADLLTAARALLADPAGAAAKAARGQARISAEYGRAAMAARFAAFYERLAARR